MMRTTHIIATAALALCTACPAAYAQASNDVGGSIAVATALSKDAVITTREQAQSWLKLAGYQPAEMHIPPLKRLGARMFKANVAFDDHPNALRFNDRIQTVTVDSMMAFFGQRYEGWQMLTVKGPVK